MTVVSADLGLLPDADVLRPRVWIGDTLVVRVQFRDEARKPVEPPGPVVFLWKSPSNVVLELPGVAVAGKVGAYNCEYQVPTTGLWAVRADGGDGQPLEWTEVTVVPEPPVGSIPQQSIWLSAVGVAAVSTRGTHLAGATIPQFPAKATLEASDTIPGVDADGNSVRLPGNAVIDAALATVAPAVEQVTAAAATVATQAGEVAGNAQLADTKAAEAVDARNQAQEAKEAAAISAANAAGTIKTGEVRTDITDQGLVFVDEMGFIAGSLSKDGLTFRTLGAAVSLLPDGTSRLSRPDGATVLDLLPDGSIRVPGQSFVTGGTGAWGVTDPDGFVSLRVNADASVQAGGFRLTLVDGVATILGPDGATLVQAPYGGAPTFAGTVPAINITHSDFAQIFADELGFVGFATSALGVSMGQGLAKPPGVNIATWTAAEIATRNNKNLSVAAATARQREDAVARPLAAFSHFISLGQSLAVGYQGFPSLTRANRYPGLLMIGPSVHPTDEETTDWIPRGEAVLTPLVATVPSKNSTTALVDPAGQATLSVAGGNSNRGETILEGALSFLRRSWNDARGVQEDAAHRFIASANGSSGNALEEISKGWTPEKFNRVRSLTTLAKGLATAAGGDYGIGAYLFAQGEANYQGSTAGGLSGASDATKAGYKAKLKQYRADLRSDVETGIVGQSRLAPFFTYQTGAQFTVDTFDLAIGQAQWELSEEEPGWYLAAPVYPVTDAGGHLDANGYRWLGQQFGKAMTRVLVDGRRWRPTCPLTATVRGREVMVDFHVPHPPLVWDLPYIMNAATDFPVSRGFSALDDGGAIPVLAAEIVADTVVKLTLNRVPGAGIKLRYADNTLHQGNGCLRDSDPTVASELYEYTAGSGQVPEANIPALVGKPYPLHNWCVAFSIPITAG
jgi:hypothetical protein